MLARVIMNQLLRMGWSFPFARTLAPRRPVIVLYHGVPARDVSTMSAEVFERHILFLKRHFEFVSPHDPDRARAPQQKLRVLLTFDDGFRNNAEVAAPLLRKHDVPAIFFVASRHATPGKYLWFSHMRALETCFREKALSFRGTQYDMSPMQRSRSFQKLGDLLLSLRPHPAAMYEALERELPRLEDFVSKGELTDHYAGMTSDQVAALAADPLFALGAHTVDHPFLTRCEPKEALRQIRENRAWLEAASGRRCNDIAYPSGDYSAELLSVCREEGFKRGFATSTRIDPQSILALPRLGIYSESTDVLGFKVQWGSLLREVRIPVG
jgi:peptidoglycan/xylan/chitin deacetylase (PgdA/CDA1 family)